MPLYDPRIMWYKTRYPGVGYRKHSIRRFNGQADKYFAIRYKINNKLKEEGLGWASEGMNAQKAMNKRSELREAYRTGDGAQTLAETRELVLLLKPKAHGDNLIFLAIKFFTQGQEQS